LGIGTTCIGLYSSWNYGHPWLSWSLFKDVHLLFGADGTDRWTCSPPPRPQPRRRTGAPKGEWPGPEAAKVQSPVPLGESLAPTNRIFAPFSLKATLPGTEIKGKARKRPLDFALAFGVPFILGLDDF